MNDSKLFQPGIEAHCQAAREEAIRLAAFSGLIARIPPGEEVEFGELWLQARKAVDAVYAAERRAREEILSELEKQVRRITQALRYEPPSDESKEER